MIVVTNARFGSAMKSDGKENVDWVSEHVIVSIFDVKSHEHDIGQFDDDNEYRLIKFVNCVKIKKIIKFIFFSLSICLRMNGVDHILFFFKFLGFWKNKIFFCKMLYSKYEKMKTKKFQLFI